MGTDSRHWEREKRILKMWEEEKVFERSVKNREGSKPFVFYEGPPTANGLPHAGHALGRTIKDLVPRYQTMRGRQVIRKAGWDTHGLPVELGVEKALGISGKQEIEEYGIAAFVEKCRESVFEYEKQWRKFTRDLGYWVDMDHPYITMDNDYIESVWHILGTIHDKGLLYKGRRVSPYCTSCQTSLSSHETAQGYKDVKDLSVTVKFKLTDREKEYVLGWTTTPWTLPANTALAVNGELDYVRVRSGGETYIAAKSRLPFLEGHFDGILDVFKGSELVGLKYEPPFFQPEAGEGYTITEAAFVTDTSGTGIVHIAPAYGEEDYQLAQEKGLPFIHAIDGAGTYLPGTPLSGKQARDSNLEIAGLLREMNLLFRKETYEHSYPHCWRCDTPLIYLASESWFIRMTALKEELVSANRKVNWHPEHLRDGRFGNFLENLVDWNISRSRYWGTPLNVWICGDCGREAVPKSRGELESLSGRDLTDLDLHKSQTDAVTFECPSCRGTMQRAPEVIDVWFDSGAMPFAQYHHPFEDGGLFQQQFPADAVIEGIDQTRGWFYSLLAVSMIYTGKLPYKHVLATGHVLDEKGLKMSKSRGNAIDPSSLIEEFGADALRWALVHDSAPWNPKRFSKRNVLEARSKMIDTLASICRFYTLYTEMDGWTPRERSPRRPDVLMDRWILSRLSGVNASMREDLDHFRLTEAARTGAAFVDDVSNWYIRICRGRFWQEGMNDDKESAYQTLHTVLAELSKLLAPFIPFITEDIHTALAGSSVHLADYPDLPEEWMDPGLDREAVREMCELGRRIRHTGKLKIKQPLARMIILPMQGEPLLSGEMLSILKEELNVKEIEWADKASDWICLSAKLNFKTAGPRLGHLANKTNEALVRLSAEGGLHTAMAGPLVLSVEGENIELGEDEILVKRSVSRPGYAEASGRRFSVILELTLNEALIREGTAREFIRLVQDLRKQLDLPVEKRIELEVECSADLRRLLEDHTELLERGILFSKLSFKKITEGKALSLSGEDIFIAVC